MRRHALLFALLISQFHFLPASLSAQEASPDNAVARQEAEDNYKNLNARLEDLAAANEALQKNLNKLREDLQKVSEEVARANEHSKDTATLESLKQLKAAIEEVDSKRIADQKLVLAELENLRKIIERPIVVKPPPNNGNPPPSTRSNPTTSTRTETPRTVPEKGYNYTIRDGDRLDKIIKALNGQGLKVTQKQVMDANPGVNWNKLHVKQVIFIPAPPL